MTEREQAGRQAISELMAEARGIRQEVRALNTNIVRLIERLDMSLDLARRPARQPQAQASARDFRDTVGDFRAAADAFGLFR